MVEGLFCPSCRLQRHCLLNQTASSELSSSSRKYSLNSSPFGILSFAADVYSFFQASGSFSAGAKLVMSRSLSLIKTATDFKARREGALNSQAFQAS